MIPGSRLEMTFGRRLHVFSTWAPTQDAVHVVESDLSQRHGSESMNDDQRLREETEKVLEATRRRYGFVPVVNQVLSERPDLFLPMTGQEAEAPVRHRRRDRCRRGILRVGAVSARPGRRSDPRGDPGGDNHRLVHGDDPCPVLRLQEICRAFRHRTGPVMWNSTTLNTVRRMTER